MKIGNIFSFVCENWIYFWRKHWKMRQKSAHYTEFSNKEEKENSQLGKLAILCDLLLVETSIKDLNIFFHACRLLYFYMSIYTILQFNTEKFCEIIHFISVLGRYCSQIVFPVMTYILLYVQSWKKRGCFKEQ